MPVNSLLILLLFWSILVSVTFTEGISMPNGDIKSNNKTDEPYVLVLAKGIKMWITGWKRTIEKQNTYPPLSAFVNLTGTKGEKPIKKKNKRKKPITTTEESLHYYGALNSAYLPIGHFDPKPVEDTVFVMSDLKPLMEIGNDSGSSPDILDSNTDPDKIVPSEIVQHDSEVITAADFKSTNRPGIKRNALVDFFANLETSRFNILGMRS